MDGTYSVMDLQPGTYHMDGTMALYYARSRQGSTDFNRMNRQRCVLAGAGRAGRTRWP